MLRCRLSGNLSGASQIYEKLLDVGKAKKVCTVCDRHLNDREMVVFEKFVRLIFLGQYGRELTAR